MHTSQIRQTRQTTSPALVAGENPAAELDAAAVLPSRGEDGATTAEYATVTGAGVGFGALLFKFLTSDAGQELLQTIFRGIGSLLPF